MLELALEGVERTAIWTDELDRARAGEPSFWINTVRRARAALGEHALLRFLIGADQAVQFHRWRDPRGVLSLAEAAVIGRAEIDSPRTLRRAMSAAGFWSEPELDAWQARFVDVGTVVAASTAIRAGDPARLAPAVARFIAEERLYEDV
jgi:nicotinic acid mononucleotide adenylyltransferase